MKKMFSDWVLDFLPRIIIWVTKFSTISFCSPEFVQNPGLNDINTEKIKKKHFSLILFRFFNHSVKLSKNRK